MEVLGVALGASVALLWGIADTIAAVAARRIGTYATTLIAQAGGLISLALVGVLASGQMSLFALSPTALTQSVLIGVLLGIVSAGAYLGLYHSLELGPLVIVSPIVGGQGAVTLVLAVVFLHDRLDLVHLLLLLVIVLGIVLTSTKVEQLVSQGRSLGAWLSSGVRYALLSMLCFGILSFGFGAAATQIPSWFLVLFWARLFSLLFLVVTTLASSPQQGASERTHRATGYLLAVGGGIVEVGGYIAFVFAAQLASTAVVGVCASLVPLIPLLFGVFAYRERATLNQLAGIALSLIGLIALPLDEGQGRWLLLAIAVAGAGALAVAAVKWAQQQVRARVATLTAGVSVPCTSLAQDCPLQAEGQGSRSFVSTWDLIPESICCYSRAQERRAARFARLAQSAVVVTIRRGSLRGHARKKEGG
jgi:drug/metabolite transporter (DMT)-like permease